RWWVVLLRPTSVSQRSEGSKAVDIVRSRHVAQAPASAGAGPFLFSLPAPRSCPPFACPRSDGYGPQTAPLVPDRGHPRRGEPRTDPPGLAGPTVERTPAQRVLLPRLLHDPSSSRSSPEERPDRPTGGRRLRSSLLSVDPPRIELCRPGRDLDEGSMATR